MTQAAALIITFNVTRNMILSDEAKDVVLRTVKFHAGRKYILYACVVMESHAHMALQPLETKDGAVHSLAGIMHNVKSYSAHGIRKQLGSRGPVWQDESYDCVIRDERTYLDTISYVLANPVKAGAVEKPEDYRWLHLPVHLESLGA